MAWTWAGASRPGTSHIKAGTRCDDASRAFLTGSDAEPVFAVICSDGAGSAEFGAQGAALVCRVFGQAIRGHFRATTALPDEEVVHEWLDQVRDRIAVAAAPRGASLRDFAATLVAVLVTSTDALVMHVGDGAAVVRAEGEWRIASWPASGEYASTTFFVTDEAGPQLRVTRLGYAPEALAVFTDGIERLVLDFAQQVPHAPFFRGIIAPVQSSEVIGRDRRLSAGLGAYLETEEVNARTDDDKSLVLAVRR